MSTKESRSLVKIMLVGVDSASADITVEWVPTSEVSPVRLEVGETLNVTARWQMAQKSTVRRTVINGETT